MSRYTGLRVVFCLGCALWGQVALGAEPEPAPVKFDNQFLRGNAAANMDLSRFAVGELKPGVYAPDVYVNGMWVARRTVRAQAQSWSAQAVPCVDRTVFDQLQIRIERLPPEVLAELRSAGADSCLNLAALLPGASVYLDVGEQRLEVTIPQLYMRRGAGGVVDATLWDPGINAATLGYTLNYNRQSGAAGDVWNGGFVGLQAGVNVGAWRLRHNGALSFGGGSTNYGVGNTYLERAIPEAQAVLTMGNLASSNRFFESMAFLGVQAQTDTRMLPLSKQTFHPTIRGNAATNAKVTVTQNGRQVYETTVTPGEFELDDLNNSGYGGDMTVTITEQDGSQRSYVVPYGLMPQLLAPGSARYSILAGQSRSEVRRAQTPLLEMSGEYGWSDMLTGYAGLRLAAGYRGLLAGSALNTHYGALAADLTHAWAELGDGTHSAGRSWRMAYSRNLINSGTNIVLAAYRDSTEDYWSLPAVLQARWLAQHGVPSEIGKIQRPRRQLQLNVNQNLGSVGAFYLAGTVSELVQDGRRATSLQMGYSAGYKRLQFNVGASISRDQTSRAAHRLFAGVTIPLDFGRASDGGNAGRVRLASFSSTVSTSNDTGTQVQERLFTTLGDEGQYAVSAQSEQNSRGPSGFALGAQSRNQWSQYGVAYGRRGNTSSATVNLAGGMVLHAGGVTLGQQLGDTIALVEVPNATGARVQQGLNARIDSAGYALVPTLTPFTMNDIDLDTKGMPEGVELTGGSSSAVAPYAGAVVKIPFKTSVFKSSWYRIVLDNGTTPPFGAEVLSDGTVIGVLGQSGRVELKNADPMRRYRVRWRSGQHEAGCELSLPPEAARAGVRQFQGATCQTVGASSAVERKLQ